MAGYCKAMSMSESGDSVTQSANVRQIRLEIIKVSGHKSQSGFSYYKNHKQKEEISSCVASSVVRFQMVKWDNPVVPDMKKPLHYFYQTALMSVFTFHCRGSGEKAVVEIVCVDSCHSSM